MIILLLCIYFHIFRILGKNVMKCVQNEIVLLDDSIDTIENLLLLCNLLSWKTKNSPVCTFRKVAFVSISICKALPERLLRCKKSVVRYNEAIVGTRWWSTIGKIRKRAETANHSASWRFIPPCATKSLTDVARKKPGWVSDLISSSRDSLNDYNYERT